MKIEGIAFVTHSNSVTKIPADSDIVSKSQNKDFTEYLKVKETQAQSVNIPRNVTREMIQDFAEWYFKQGRYYESSKSYKMAISAYEKANSVQPDMAKAASIDSARQKAYPLDVISLLKK
jgi:tetratricopeptide (TPR) repeat protein